MIELSEGYVVLLEKLHEKLGKNCWYTPTCQDNVDIYNRQIQLYKSIDFKEGEQRTFFQNYVREHLLVLRWWSGRVWMKLSSSQLWHNRVKFNYKVYIKFNLFITLTYFLMDNFCPCFLYIFTDQSRFKQKHPPWDLDVYLM